MKNNKGFSLLELMIAIVIIGMVMAIGVPNYRGWLERRERDVFFSDVKNLIESARYRAITSGITTKITFDLTNNSAWIEGQTHQKDVHGAFVFEKIKKSFGAVSMVWNNRFLFRSFSIEGVDEISRYGAGKATQEVWFFIVPEGIVQRVAFIVADTKDIVKGKARQFLCSINVFSGMLKVEDA